MTPLRWEIVVKPLSRPRNWEVVEGFSYAGVSIPEKFEFDGCSIPYGLRWRFKHGGAKFAAAAMHDYLYRTGIVSKARADMIFFELMIANGVSEHDAKIMYTGVKYGGGWAWRARRKEQRERCSNK